MGAPSGGSTPIGPQSGLSDAAGHAPGHYWRTPQGEFWKVADRGPESGSWRIVQVDPTTGEDRAITDVVWGAELGGAVRVCIQCLGELEDDRPGPGCESWYEADGKAVHGPCDGREF